MKIKWIAVAAALTLSTTLAIAAPHGGPLARGGRGERSGIVAKLNLTDAQKGQIKEIRRTAREANKATFEQARLTMREFRAARRAHDTAAVERIRPVVREQRAAIRAIRRAEHEQVLAVLTAEQRAELERIRAERRTSR